MTPLPVSGMPMLAAAVVATQGAPYITQSAILSIQYRCPDMPNSAISNPRLSSTAGPLPIAEKGLQFPLSGGIAKMVSRH
jgi:hypothetical protein